MSHFRHRSLSNDWETSYIPLRKGQYRVYLEATVDKSTQTSEDNAALVNVAVDDIYIGPCVSSKFHQFNLYFFLLIN